MNSNLTEIVFILDESGSMGPLAEDTIGGYNAFLEEQKNLEGSANVTTVLFNNSHLVLHDRVAIQHMEPLTKKDYCPRGMTALYDAIGYTIDSVGKHLASTPEERRPGKVIFVITTDGAENCSSHYTQSKVRKMIQHHQDVYSWEFIFLGAGIDAYRASNDIGINAAHTASYAASTDGLDNIYLSMTKAVHSIRSTGDLAADWKEAGEVFAPTVNTDAVARAVTSAMCPHSDY